MAQGPEPPWERYPGTRRPGANIVPSVAALMLLAASSTAAIAAGDASRGAELFTACAACHSTKPGTQMTGPSLAKIWEHKAGTVAGFHRYSEALIKSGVVWNDANLDRWLTDPQAFIQGTTMTFAGISDRERRQDVIAYLREVSEGKAAAPKSSTGGMSGMAGMTSKRANLKEAPPEGRVTSLTHCKDTYTVTTADGRKNKVWEFNLRLKTDSSALGPLPGKPVIVGAGMQGDRASVVFSTPGEISRYIVERCP